MRSAGTCADGLERRRVAHVVVVEARDEGAAARRHRHRRARPAHARHEVPAQDADAEPAHRPQQVAEPAGLLLAPLEPEAHPVERRRRLDDGELQPVVGVEPLQQRERHLAPGRVAAQRGGAGRATCATPPRASGRRRRDARDADLRQRDRSSCSLSGETNLGELGSSSNARRHVASPAARARRGSASSRCRRCGSGPTAAPAASRRRASARPRRTPPARAAAGPARRRRRAPARSAAPRGRPCPDATIEPVAAIAQAQPVTVASSAPRRSRSSTRSA